MYVDPQTYPQVYPPQVYPQFPAFQSPPQFQPHSIEKHRHWDSNLCDCCIDCSTCCRAFTCPCCVFQDLVNHIEHTNNSCTPACFCLVVPCSWFIHSPYRKKLRVKYNLPAKPCNDLCTVFCCPCCALAQELNEINKHTSPLNQLMV